MYPDYTNPTKTTNLNPQFGTSAQFNIPPFQTPYPFEQDIATNKDYINRFTSFIPQQRGLYESQLGLPLLRENFLRGNEVLNNLQARIFNVPQQIKQTSTESLLSEGQRSRLQEATEAPMRKDLGILGQQQSALGSALNLYEGVASKWEEQGLLPWEKEYDAITRIQAAQLTGWTTANRNELDRLIANQKSGLTWTDNEAERANKLALAEAEYRRTMDMVKEQGNQARMTKKAPTDLATLWSSFNS